MKMESDKDDSLPLSRYKIQNGWQLAAAVSSKIFDVENFDCQLPTVLLLFDFADFKRAVADREFQRNAAVSRLCRN